MVARWVHNPKVAGSNLKGYIETIYGIEILEFCDKNYLCGNDCSKGKSKIETLNLALKKIDEICQELKLI